MQRSRKNVSNWTEVLLTSLLIAGLVITANTLLAKPQGKSPNELLVRHYVDTHPMDSVRSEGSTSTMRRESVINTGVKIVTSRAGVLKVVDN
jgi:hypothetical protein